MDADRRFRLALSIFGVGSLLLGAGSFTTDGVTSGTLLVTAGGAGLIVYSANELFGSGERSLEVMEDRNWVMLVLVTMAFVGGLLTIL